MKTWRPNELVDLREAIARVLIPEIGQPEKISEFADMYAQTIVYGLFAARCNHRGPTPFLRSGAASEIPKTNPFLRKLFASITGLGIEDEPHAPFIDDLVQILNSTDIDAVLSNFGKRSKQEDPVIHFYETFLKVYDPGLRELRGVYYTPEPVVSYIVRSVDLVLKNHFEISGGFLDTLSEAKYEREKYFTDYRGRPEDQQLPKTVELTCPKVLILDPACGTGTFLYNIIDYIRNSYMETMGAGYWSLFVREKLLKRIFGFELLMASYAVAHFKLGMQLAGRDLPDDQQDFWRYDFASNERLGIFLTNTLQEAENIWNTLFSRTLTEEANEASVVKKDMPIMVVLGNPPYSGHSANSSWEIVKGTKRRNFIGQLLNDYYYVDGKPLGEKNPKWLQDDYVKFIRWGQWRIERTGVGVLAFITNNGYLENPTFRGMRQQLMNTFNEIYILNLHGNSKKKEYTPDGSKDENVFDIQQGVAIGIFIKTSEKNDQANVYYSDLWGSRDLKYQNLLEMDIKSTKWIQLAPRANFYLFVPREINLDEEYHQGCSVIDIFPINSAGIVTARDDFAIGFESEELMEKVRDFISLSTDEAREKYDLRKDVRDWKVHLAQEDVRNSGVDPRKLVHILYRPFDKRFTYYTGKTRGLICMPRPDVMHNMLRGKNIGLSTTRSIEIGRGWEHVFCSSQIIQHHTVSLKEVNYLLPLYVFPKDLCKTELISNISWPIDQDGRIPNLSPDFILALEKNISLKFVSSDEGDLKVTFGPENVFHYIYAILHSPTYRLRYSDQLKRDFPKVPLTSSHELFRELCAIGKELVSLHLLESRTLDGSNHFTRSLVKGDYIVHKGYPKYVASEDDRFGCIKINETQYLEGIPQEVWDFHIGGYKVCEKWLKDRRGRQLSYDDLTHYQKVLVALKETIRIMEEIDQAIPEWPIK